MTNPDDETHFNKFVIFVVIAVIWLFVAKDFGNWIMPINWTTIFIIIALWTSGELPFWISRYKMPWFVSRGIAGSFSSDDDPLAIPDVMRLKDGRVIKFSWLVYRLGACKFPFPMNGKIATVVVPDYQVDRRHRHHDCVSMTFKFPFVELPQVVFNRLSQLEDDYNLKDVYFGGHSINFEIKDYEVDKDEAIKSLQRQVNSKSRMLTGDFSEFEKVKRLVDIINPKKSLTDSIKAVISRNPEDEN